GSEQAARQRAARARDRQSGGGVRGADEDPRRRRSGRRPLAPDARGDLQAARPQVEEASAGRPTDDLPALLGLRLAGGLGQDLLLSLVGAAAEAGCLVPGRGVVVLLLRQAQRRNGVLV